MVYILFLLTLTLLIVLGLYSTANGAGPAALSPVQAPLKPVGAALAGAVGVLGIIAVIWGIWNVILFVISIETIGYGFLTNLLNLIVSLTLVVVGTLAGYASVASFFGAPASGAGTLIDWIKRTFGPIESIVGLVSLALAIYVLVKFIIDRT